MATEIHLQRFLDAQQNRYAPALEEITRGRKQSHWMWYIFPQLTGLGRSETSRYYAIAGQAEAEEYLNHPILSKRLIEISEALLKHRDRSAYDILGSPDDIKLQSSMTLFGSLQGADPVFHAVLDLFFDGKKDLNTLRMLSADKK